MGRPSWNSVIFAISSPSPRKATSHLRPSADCTRRSPHSAGKSAIWKYEVGAELLTRGARGVELTAAGRAFLDHARLALAQVDAAGESARRAAHPARKTFAIGFQTGHEMNWLSEAMHVLRDELHRIEVTISELATHRTSPMRSFVASSTWRFSVSNRASISSYRVVTQEPLVVLMPSDHRLTARESIRPQDIIGETFIAESNKATVLRGVTESYLQALGRRSSNPITGSTISPWPCRSSPRRAVCR